MPDYLQEIEEQLVELTERGAHRRRVRADLLVAASALIVVAAVVAVVATAGGGRNLGTVDHRSPTLAPSQTTGTTPSGTTPAATTPPAPGGPVPTHFAPSSFTAISELDWWLLGSAPCSSPPCTSIVRTSDGGRTFVGIPAPRTANVAQLRFADARDGFAYGPELWATHDGGASWHRIDLRGTVTDLAASDGWVYAICSGVLERSPVGSDQWAVVPRTGSLYPGSLWAQGAGVLVEGAAKVSQLILVSQDHGQTFNPYPVPPNVACRFQEPSPPVVWEHCATGMLSGLWISPDGGRTYSQVKGPLPELPNSAAFAAATSTTAVVGFHQLYRTTDGGASWAPVPQPAAGINEWMYVGFTDPTHGAGLALTGATREQLFYTTDGGASWHPVPIV
jgi:photosystem II stability/assembly factor-like uncharacterized protein